VNLNGKRVDLPRLKAEATTAGVVVGDLGTVGLDATGLPDELITWDDQGATIDVPAAMAPVVAAHVPPPLVVEFAGSTQVEAIVRTTDAAPLVVFRFPTLQKRLYQGNLTISGIDAVSGASKLMEGRFVWKRPAAAAVMVGLTVVSDIHDAAAASWAPNAAPQGADIVFTVTGTAGRTIDWLLAGAVDVFAPGGLEG
jgi:hypothetical protein